MEKSIPDFSERRADPGRALLMLPEPNPETFPALEHPQGEERRAPFLQDAKKPAENSALSGTELEEDAFYGVEELAAMSREGKGPELREEPDFFSSLARQEPDVALEAHDEADEPDPALSGAVPAAAHRTQLGPTTEEHLEFPKALYRPELRNVSGGLSWDSSTGMGEGIEESTLERLPGSKDSTEFLEPQVVTEPLDSEQEDLEAENAAPESPNPPEEKYPQNEPKHLEGLGTEHPEKSRRGIQRLEWISRAPRSPSPPFKDLHQAADVAAGAAFRGPAGREAAPAFRKLAKAKPSESCRRKGLVAEPDTAEFGSVQTPEWAAAKAGKQSWTVNAEDSVERLLPEPCGAYEVEVRPYVCGVLVEEEKAEEELEREEEEEEESPAVFTCIECSIYFRKKEHLLEHMLQHSRGTERGHEAPAGRSHLCCGECGWAFADATSLERHKRLHQESREKIIEEIQKLDSEFPDEGREARLQCPKCVFGTNSSKIFVQHAKMHVKERKDHASKSSNLFGEIRESSGHGLYKPFQAEELPAAAKGLSSSCVLCGFPAPNEHILKEHVRYAHSHFSWEPELYEDDPNQPGTSRDSYSPARPGRFSDVEFFGKTERFFPPPSRESSSHYDPTPASFGLGQPRLDKSNGATKKDSSGFHARKAAPYHKPLGFAGFPSSRACSQLALQQLRKRAAAQQLEGDSDDLRGHQPAPGLEEPRLKWPPTEEEMELGDVAVPQAALDLKRTFGAILRATEPAVTSEEQRHQLRMMVPVVVLEEMTPHPKLAKRPRGKPLKKKLLLPPPPPPLPPPPRDLLLEDSLPLDVLLLDTPLEGPLELDDLLDSESAMLKNEERKCPYCPDRFHNGIGLANHVRGHLNRVGVSYNVRHFISAEEVKAIEQKFSFQKKKKKVANFDPGTFSLMRCEFCGAGFDTRAGLSSHARAHLRDFGITNWELTVSPIHILKELLANSSSSSSSSSSEHPALLRAALVGSATATGRVLGSPSGSQLAPFPWGDEALQPYRDVLAPAEEDLVAMEVTSPPPPLPKKSPANTPLEPPRLGTKLSPEPPGAKAEPQDSKAPSLTTCEVCGACFETRKGLSSHARSHLRQLGVAESESSGAPIDLLYELVRHKGKAEGSSSSSSSSSSLPQPPLAKKSASPKEPCPPRALLLLPKERPAPDGALNKAIKSPPGFSKGLAPPPASPGIKKVLPGSLPGSPSPKNAEEKGSKLALSPLPASPKSQWAPEEDGPLNLTSEPCRDIRCEFCGEFFENRKGLSSHARSHLRQMGVTEWYVNGSPIDTLREILTRRRSAPSSAHPKAVPKSLLAGLAPLEAPPRPPPPPPPPPPPGELHVPGLGKKVPSPLSPAGPASGAASPPPPTARKMFPGLSPPSLQKKLKQDQLRVEIKRELMAGGGGGVGGGGGGGGGGAGIHPGEPPAPPDPAWAAREEMAPLNLSSRADPVRDIRCEFCGEFFENRKGLSSHARSHLRQMGVTEWSVNGSPIDTLREILRKKSKPCLIKKEPPVAVESPKGPSEDDAKGPPGAAPGAKALPPGLSLAPLGGRPGKPGSGSAAGAALALAPLGSKNPGAFLAPKRPLGEERLGAPGEAKHKAFELPYKAKALHDKASEACCELCGLYFENRKALASHARAHLRQFGVTEWCVNGSPIETLREWIRHRPHKAGAYRSYIQGGRPFSKKFRNSSHPREHRGALAVPLFLGKGALGAEAALGESGKGAEGAERALGTPLGVVKVEEQRANISKFERRQARPLDAALARDEDPGVEFPRKLEEPRPPPPRVRPVPALVPRPPQTSLVKFVGNIYTLKCRFCEVEFQGPLSIQEDWVRHLQRHILDMNFSKADPCRNEIPSEPPALAEAP